MLYTPALANHVHIKERGVRTGCKTALATGIVSLMGFLENGGYSQFADSYGSCREFNLSVNANRYIHGCLGCQSAARQYQQHCQDNSQRKNLSHQVTSLLLFLLTTMRSRRKYK